MLCPNFNRRLVAIAVFDACLRPPRMSVHRRRTLKVALFDLKRKWRTRLAAVVSHTHRAGRSWLQGSLSALQTNCEVPAIRPPSTTGRHDALDHSSCHLHREVLIGIGLLSDAVVRELDLSAGIDATGEGIGLGGAR